MAVAAAAAGVLLCVPAVVTVVSSLRGIELPRYQGSLVAAAWVPGKARRFVLRVRVTRLDGAAMRPLAEPLGVSFEDAATGAVVTGAAQYWMPQPNGPSCRSIDWFWDRSFASLPPPVRAIRVVASELAPPPWWAGLLPGKSQGSWYGAPTRWSIRWPCPRPR